jgi:hypothetical protein
MIDQSALITKRQLQEVIDITVETGAQRTVEKSFSFDPDLKPISIQQCWVDLANSSSARIGQELL